MCFVRCVSCQWMATQRGNECPVCKAGISEANVTPIYLGGRTAERDDPRSAPYRCLLTELVTESGAISDCVYTGIQCAVDSCLIVAFG